MKKSTFGPPARCKKCNTVIQSKHRHDFVWCKCGAIAIDGGAEYIKCTGDYNDFDFKAGEEYERRHKK
jgi:hypothetical protein